MKTAKPPTLAQTPFERFTDFAKRVLRVPKSEVEHQMQVYKQERRDAKELVDKIREDVERKSEEVERNVEERRRSIRKGARRSDSRFSL